jgi:hypothetical protein
MAKVVWYDGLGSVINTNERVQYRSLEMVLSRFYVNCAFQYLDTKRLTQESDRCDN